MHDSLIGKNESALYKQWFLYIDVPFKTGLTVLLTVVLNTNKLLQLYLSYVYKLFEFEHIQKIIWQRNVFLTSGSV
jgi:hypothetical protein